MINVSPYSVAVMVNGKSVQYHFHNNKCFIEARQGTEYSIKVSNDSYVRALAEISVDGINVISGKPCDKLKRGEGYIVNGNSSIDIKGFRKDSNTVGAFKFCKKSDSYCNEAGLGGNNGVIGVRIYSEDLFAEVPKPINWPKPIPTPTPTPWVPTPWVPTIPWEKYPPLYIQDSTWTTCNLDAPLSKGILRDISPRRISVSTVGGINYSTVVGSSATSSPDFELGTSWGTKLNDAVVTVDFKACKTFTEFEIFYDTRQNLEKYGIKFKKESQISWPSAFTGFATPPKGWN
jgi:hypothetical protein